MKRMKFQLHTYILMWNHTIQSILDCLHIEERALYTLFLSLFLFLAATCYTKTFMSLGIHRCVSMGLCICMCVCACVCADTALYVVRRYRRMVLHSLGPNHDVCGVCARTHNTHAKHSTHRERHIKTILSTRSLGLPSSFRSVVLSSVHILHRPIRHFMYIYSTVLYTEQPHIHKIQFPISRVVSPHNNPPFFRLMHIHTHHPKLFNIFGAYV